MIRYKVHHNDSLIYVWSRTGHKNNRNTCGTGRKLVAGGSWAAPHQRPRAFCMTRRGQFSRKACPAGVTSAQWDVRCTPRRGEWSVQRAGRGDVSARLATVRFGCGVARYCCVAEPHAAGELSLGHGEG